MAYRTSNSWFTSFVHAIAPKRRVISVIGAVVLLLTGAVYALAVHENTALELDGNTVNDVVAGDDWNDLDDGVGDPSADDSALVSAFQHDEAQPDLSHHEPSNKDDNAIDGPGTNEDWGCVVKMNVNDKDDLRHAYAAAYDIGGDLHLFFGADRDTNNGSANIAAWFFQTPVHCDPASVEDGGTDGNFTGHKTDGDLFIVSEFTNGGRVAAVNIFIWTDPTPLSPESGDECLGDGVDCSTAHSGQDHPFATGIDCQATTDPHLDPGSPNVCATVNGDGDGNHEPSDAIDVPWETTDDPESAEFFEGGLNLDALFPTGLDCFSQVMIETRSSFEFNANLFDLSFLNFDTCASKSGHKFEDENANGIDDGAGDANLANWDITLYNDADGSGTLNAGDTVAATTSTDGSGSYLFDALNPGKYIVCEVAQDTDHPGTWFQSAPMSGVTEATATCDFVAGNAEWGYGIELSATENDTGNDFGNFQQGTKSGTKVEDMDGDGDITEDAANGLAGWQINVYVDDGDGILSAAEYAAGAVGSGGLTDASGDYEVTGLDPGDYIACEETQTDWTQSYPTSGADCTGSSGATDLAAIGWTFSITSGEDEEDNDFGNWTPATKSGFKFNDNDMDGTFEPAPSTQNDTTLANWVIELWKWDGAAWVFVATDTTDGNGEYEFAGLTAGVTYAVCEITQTDWVQSFPFSGATLPAGETVFDCTQLTPSGGGTFAPFGYQFTAASGAVLDDNPFGNFLVPPGCSLTQGYWKTHSDQGPAPYDADGWGALGDVDGDGLEEEEGEAFFDSGMTWYQVFWTSPKGGNAWYILAHQYMAAILNQANGAGNPAGLTQALADAETLLGFYDDQTNIPKNANNVLTSTKDRAEAIAIAGFLASYNEGTLEGTSHCGEENFAGFGQSLN